MSDSLAMRSPAEPSSPTHHHRRHPSEGGKADFPSSDPHLHATSSPKPPATSPSAHQHRRSQGDSLLRSGDLSFHIHHIILKLLHQTAPLHHLYSTLRFELGFPFIRSDLHPLRRRKEVPFFSRSGRSILTSSFPSSGDHSLLHPNRSSHRPSCHSFPSSSDLGRAKLGGFPSPESSHSIFSSTDLDSGIFSELRSAIICKLGFRSKCEGHSFLVWDVWPKRNRRGKMVAEDTLVLCHRKCHQLVLRGCRETNPESLTEDG